MDFKRYRRGEAALRQALDFAPSEFVPIQFACKMGKYTFIVARSAGLDQWTASWKDGVTGRTNWLGDQPPGMPAFKTQTEAERACEKVWKTLRN